MRFRPRRIPARYETTAELPGRLSRVTVRDVSAEGARIDGAGRLAVGSRCALRVVSDVLTAQVRWVADDRAGIRFDRPLAPRQLDTLRAATTPGRSRSAPRRHFSFTELR